MSRISCGLGRSDLDKPASIPAPAASSRMISLHKSMHSSQMNTDGPAMSFLTSCWLLPQNEQYNSFSLFEPFLSAMDIRASGHSNDRHAVCRPKAGSDQTGWPAQQETRIEVSFVGAQNYYRPFMTTLESAVAPSGNPGTNAEPARDASWAL